MAINWPGLFAWSTKYHDGTSPSQFQQMTDEDRKFLEKAMEEAFGHIEDPNKVVMEAIEQIKSPDRTPESMMTALEIVDRLCDDPDVARNIEKLGGLQPLLDMAKEVEGPLRFRCLEILALLFSNNPNIQEAGIARGALHLFLQQTRKAARGSVERSKAFRALVALVRPLKEHESTFLHAEGGVELLVELLDGSEDAGTREKAMSFIVSMAAVQRALNAADVAPLATAVAPLFAHAGDHPVQYREVLAACGLDLSRFAPMACKAILVEPVQARIRVMAAAPQVEGADTSELAALQECIAVLSANFLDGDPSKIVGDYVAQFEDPEHRAIARAAPEILKLLLDRSLLASKKVVADFGAGTGLFMESFAKVAQSVYSLEINKAFLDHLRHQVTEKQLGNVHVVEATGDDPCLPQLSVDLVFICDVYHHIEYPKTVCRRLREALRPGGRLVVIDFIRDDSVHKSHPPGWILDNVRAGQEVFRDEIVSSGFTLLEEPSIPGLDENYCMIFERSAEES